MRNVLAVFCFLGLLSGSGLAQERHKPRASGFFFFAPGQRHDTGSSTLQIGGGGEGYVYKGLGFSGDAGALYVHNVQGFLHARRSEMSVLGNNPPGLDRANDGKAGDGSLVIINQAQAPPDSPANFAWFHPSDAS